MEWLAWYRMLGFTDVVVVTNNCTDHSPELLDALARAGWLFHVRRDVPPGVPVIGKKLAAARKHPSVTDADWVMICDVDEFLVIHRGAGRLSDLLSPHVLPDGRPDFLGMSINWRVFGTSGKVAYEDLPVHRQFQLACAREHGLSRWFKSIFRRPDWFGGFRSHGPCRLSLERAGQVWSDVGMRWITPDGSVLEEWRPEDLAPSFMPTERVSHAVAQINHYMLRSLETYSLKAGTPSPSALRDRYNTGYFSRADSGRERDESALRYSADWEEVYHQAMALPDVARLHDLCCKDHRRLIAERKAGAADWR